MAITKSAFQCRTAQKEPRIPDCTRSGRNKQRPDAVSGGDGPLQGAGRLASALMHKPVTMAQTWRRIMKALIAALALATLIAAPTFAQPANAAPMSPASSSFGSNGY